MLQFVKYRLNKEQAATKVQSGAVFVFCEQLSNIKRWTEGGVKVSPSHLFVPELVLILSLLTSNRNGLLLASMENSLCVLLLDSSRLLY